MSTDEQDDVLPAGRPRLLIYIVLFFAQHGLFDFIRAYTYFAVSLIFGRTWFIWCLFYSLK